jgi:hypothetical protein
VWYSTFFIERERDASIEWRQLACWPKIFYLQVAVVKMFVTFMQTFGWMVVLIASLLIYALIKIPGIKPAVILLYKREFVIIDSPEDLFFYDCHKQLIVLKSSTNILFL